MKTITKELLETFASDFVEEMKLGETFIITDKGVKIGFLISGDKLQDLLEDIEDETKLEERGYFKI